MSKRASVKNTGSPIDDIIGYQVEGNPKNVNKTTKRQNDKITEAEDDLQRVTYYFYPSQIDNIDQMVVDLNRKFNREGGRRLKVKKSEVVRLAVDMLSELTVDQIAVKLED